MSFTSRQFRDALGCFATGVTVVTGRRADGRPVGLTANAFSSVSLDPPLVLFCLDRKAESLQAFLDGRHFAVNVLRAEQEDLSNRFADPTIDRFADLAFETWETGCPILPDTLASLECTLHAHHDGGDHVIFIGRVQRIRCSDTDGGAQPATRGPLLYYRGDYRRMGSHQTEAAE